MCAVDDCFHAVRVHAVESGGMYEIQVDPARIAYGVMTGIGFLGAGAIIKHFNGVRGLTTAAGLWCVAAIGLSCGLGLLYCVNHGGGIGSGWRWRC